MAINPKLLNDGEHIVFSTRTHVKALIVPVLVLLVVAGLGGYLTSLVSGGIWLLVIWAVAAVLVLIYTVWPFLTWLTATYTVTNRRLTTHRGVITRTGHDIPLGRISDVAYEKGLLDRILGCGTLIVSDASEHGRVVLNDVPRVEELQRTMSDLLHGDDTGYARRDDGT